LYATLEGVGSARLLERLCERDLAYRWICGGVGVNHHSLSDFRVAAGPMLDDILTRSMASLVAAKVVGLDCLAVDGVRVRASAGASSFRSAERLVELEDAARRKVARLREELQSDPGAATKRSQARAAQEAQARLARLEEARKAAKAIEEERQRVAEKERRKAKKAKAAAAVPKEPEGAPAAESGKPAKKAASKKAAAKKVAVKKSTVKKAIKKKSK